MPKAKATSKTTTKTTTAKAKPAAKAAKATKTAAPKAAKAAKATKATKAPKAVKGSTSAAQETLLLETLVETPAEDTAPVTAVDNATGDQGSQDTVAGEPSAVEDNSAPAKDAPAADAPVLWEALVERLSAGFIERGWDFLVRSAPTREVWAWLGRADHAPIRLKITKGFQRTANSLRLPVVRHRLQDELRQNPILAAELLDLWANTSPPPVPVAAAREFEDDAALIEQLPDLMRRFGPEALLLTLLSSQRHAVINTWSQKIADGELTLEAPEADTTTVEAASGNSPEQQLQEHLVTARSEIEKWQQRASDAEQKMREAQAALTSARDGFARETHELRAQLKLEENRFAKEHEKLEEDERLLDRTTRKLKSAEKQVEELEADNKRLKKQVRQQQEVSEDLQKEIVELKAHIEDLENGLPEEEEEQEAEPAMVRTDPSGYLRAPAGPLPAVMVPASRTISTAPLDQVFQWNADGRTIRVTTREIKRGIDANNEGWVFALIQALDALRHASPEGYRLLLERVRELDSYYHSVLTARTTRILVDASNVARYEKNRFGKGQIRLLLSMRDELRRRGCFPIRFIADASLPYNVDNPEELNSMMKRGELEMTAAGQEADEVLAIEARRTGAFVVTNDRSFHLKTMPNFEPPRLAFQFYDKYLVIDEF